MKRIEIIAGLCAAIIALALGSLPSRATLPPESDLPFWVFFKSNSTALEGRTLQTLKLAANMAASRKGPILVMGRQDATEFDVAGGRAIAVAAKLKELGVPAARIFVGARNDVDAIVCVKAPDYFSTCHARVEITVCARTCSDELQQRFDFSRR